MDTRPNAGWSGLALLVLLLLTVTSSSEAAGWVSGLGALHWIALLAIAVGWTLAHQRWLQGWMAHIVATVMGAAWTLYQTTLILPVYEPGLALANWRQRAEVVQDRLSEWAGVVFSQGSANDNLIFVFQLGILTWLVSYICAWFLARYCYIWGAVLPSGFALLMNLYYGYPFKPGLIAYLALFMLCAVLLAARTHLALQEVEWRRARVGYSSELGMDFLRDGLVFAVVALLVAWLGPTDTGPRLRAAASRFEQPVASVQGHFTRLFAAVGYGGRGGAGGFGPTMALSGAISLNDAPIFEARVEAEPYRLRYWRMAVYDTYTGSSWQRTGEVRHGQAAGDLLDGPEFAARVPVTQTVTVLQNGTRQLYAAPQPVSFGLPTRINALRYSDEGLDVSSVESLARLNVDDEYEVVSVVSVADVANLEAAGTAYPDWIRDKYMQLPDSLPRSIRDQALKIVGRETNPYRKAAAIERWLRENMTYDERIPTPPRNRDAVDWFLFTQRAGYCDYYASAFVILTRAVGVPVRLAAGYSSGQPIGNAPGTYRQAAADAHSWPEVYFPRYGWIEFEPTAGDQPLVREEFGGPRPEESLRAVQDERQEMLPEDEMRELDRRTSAQAESGPPSEERNQPALPFALLVVSVSASVALAAVARWQWNRSLTGMSLVESAYARMSRFAAWMGVHLAAHQTPYEYARRIVERVPRGEPEIGLITEAYVRERFARCEAVGDSNALLVAWSRLRARLARGVLIHAVAAGAGRARRLLGRPGRRRRP